MRHKMTLLGPILYVGLLVLLSCIILIGVGSAGDRLAFYWRLKGPNEGLPADAGPPLSQWFSESYCYNDNELLFTSIDACLCLIALTLWCLLFRSERLLAVFLPCYILFWTIMAAFWAFLLFCVALSYAIPLSYMTRPTTCMWDINRFLIVAAPATIILMVLYKLAQMVLNHRKRMRDDTD